MPRTAFALLTFALSLAAPAAAGSLHAGVAQVEITPPPGLYLLGSGEIKAEGALDPLFARVLVLEAGQNRVAIVSLDLCRVFQAPLVQRLRDRIRKSSGIPHLILAATHTHSGPIIPLAENLPFDSMTSWQKDAVEKTALAIEQAARAAIPVRIGIGYGISYIGHNRRRVHPDGTVSMFFANPTRIPTSPVDPTVTVVRLDSESGAPYAILANYACHPVVVMGRMARYSADYPGALCALVKKGITGHPFCMFLQGGSGDVDTYYTGVAPEEDPPAKLKWTADRIGAEVVRVANSIRTEDDPAASIDVMEESLPFRWRWGPGAFEATMQKVNPPALLRYYLPEIAPVLNLPVATALINRQLALAALPGEPFVEFQMNWRARCPAPHCILLGYANGFFSYLPTIQAAAEGGHGGALWTRVEPGAGERMIDNAVVRTYEMLGRLKKAPEPPRSPSHR